MSATEKKKGEKATENFDLPAAGELTLLAARIVSFVDAPRHARIFTFLRSLAASPPQVLLIEGATPEERADVALYWGLLLNCPHVLSLQKEASPCLACPVCLRFLARMHRDLFFLDGSADSISIDSVRELRRILGEPPREISRRVVIMAEAQSLTEPAANAMLKSLEEEQRTTAFVLTVPQREWLLPTLVSRSWVLTLALSGMDAAVSSKEKEWEETAATFLQTGRGLFEHTGVKGRVKAAEVASLLTACQRGLAHAFSGNGSASALAVFFSSLPPNRLAIAYNVLAEGQESLRSQVNDALIADWVMTRLYLLRPRQRV